jgi:predicted aspartyl protease
MGRHTTLLLFCVLMFICAAASAQTTAREQILPLKIYGQHLIVVQGSIGSLQKRNLVIDTAAYPSVIDRELARKLNLSGPKEELDAIDRTIPATAVVVPTVDIGPIHVTTVRSLVQDLSDVSRRYGVRIDALVGLDVLRRSSFRIDYGARKVFFGPVDPLPFSAPLELVDSKFCVELHAGNHSVRVLVDTGAEKLMLFGSHLPWLTSASDQARAFSNLGGSFVAHEVRLDMLQLGDITLGTEPVYVSKSRNIPFYAFDGFLATAQFRQVAFDFERGEFSWLTKDRRLNRVRVASESSTAPPRVAAF